PSRPLAAALLALVALAGPAPGQPPEAPAEAEPPAQPTSAEVLEAAAPSDWRALDPERTLYVELPGGRVVIELAPEFAPRHVENVVKLAREGYFDGLAVLRSQENYVVQWGDPKAGEEGARAMRTGKAGLAAEFDRPIARDGGGDLPFTPLPDGDVYAPEVGFTLGFPAARDARSGEGSGRTWLAHCYAMVGAGRGDTADSGSGAELYVVIGHAPRHLDRTVTLLGRVVRGMEALSTLPRGTGALGFYEDPSEHVPVLSVKVAADVPPAERTPLELLRTDTATFEAWIASRRHRRESWFLDPVGRIELCNVPLPVREPPAPAPDAQP
ncbi:MAG TPA: peptidylprolyl isomerase, partial [Thermoanaerobaculia bacterium]|nr:peptidylprolyl isomerase [Thermoanaerobaculia bacterium]